MKQVHEVRLRYQLLRNVLNHPYAEAFFTDEDRQSMRASACALAWVVEDEERGIASDAVAFMRLERSIRSRAEEMRAQETPSAEAARGEKRGRQRNAVRRAS